MRLSFGKIYALDHLEQECQTHLGHRSDPNYRTPCGPDPDQGTQLVTVVTAVEGPAIAVVRGLEGMGLGFSNKSRVHYQQWEGSNNGN